MDLAQLIAAVKLAGGLRSDAEASAALRATLETLGELLPVTPAAEVAAHLPLEARPYLLEKARGERSHFSVEEFCARVTARSHAVEDQGRVYMRSVFAALLALPCGAILRPALGIDYDAVFAPRRATRQRRAA